MSFSSIVGLISRKGIAGRCSNWISRGTVAAAGCSNWISLGAAATGYPSTSGGDRRFSTVVDVSDEKSVSSFKISSPWLILQPDFEEEGGVNKNMVYKFYNIAENRVLSLNKNNRNGGGELLQENLMPDDDAKFVGSSHGWLALLNKRNSDLFLSDPLSGRHIKLPPIDTLHIPKGNLTGGVGVIKLIISCSPSNEEDCRAMICYAPADQLAFCCPGRSTEWTPISTKYNYEDFVYSPRQKLFFCTARGRYLEAWNLEDPLSPKSIPMVVSVDEENYPWAARSEEELNLKMICCPQKYLVVADELYHVRRFILERMGPDGSHVEEIYYGSDKGYDQSVPYKTIGFDVHKYDPEEKSLKYMDNSLDGLSFFIGSNHGFALSASEFPELKPNSIYFTDVDQQIGYEDGQMGYGGHDIGIFDYENRTFSPCYYPCDVRSIKRILPPPMWFTPTNPA